MHFRRLTVVATAAITVMLFRYKRHSFLSYATSALLISGGIGNLIDRILHGYVIDYIHVLDISGYPTPRTGLKVTA